MRKPSPRHLIHEWLASAGVVVNGNDPWDTNVHRDSFDKRLVAGGSWLWARVLWTAGGSAMLGTNFLIVS
jgi:hypothetical protein